MYMYIYVGPPYDDVDDTEHMSLDYLFKQSSSSSLLSTDF